MTAQSDDDAQVRRLLELLEGDRNQVSGRRDEILLDVLAHYERSRGEHRDEGATADPPVFVPVDRRPPKARSALPWVASIAVLAMVAGLIMATGGRTEQSPADQAPSNPDGVDVLVLAEGTVTIEIPDPLIVSRGGDGVALVSEVAEASGLADAVVVVDDGVTGFGEQMSRLSVEGLTTATLSRSTVDRRAADRWSISLTQTGIDQMGCAAEDDCLQLVSGYPQTTLSPGALVVAIEIVVEDQTVAVMLIDENGASRDALETLLAGTRLR